MRVSSLCERHRLGLVDIRTSLGLIMIMKKCCKNIDITDRELISRAVWSCISDKMTRKDTIKMFSEYSGVPESVLIALMKEEIVGAFDGLVDTVIDGIRQEIIDKDYKVKPIQYRIRIDNCSRKIRKIGIQDIKQQLYDYIAVAALRELFDKKLCFYQTSLKGKGADFGARAIKKWLKNKNNRWAWQGDVRHYYESIDRKRLKEMLRHDVSNEAVLHLVFFLIDTFPQGLSIGSYLSQFLANYYMARAYHYASEQLFRLRRCKGGQTKRVRLISHVLMQMDDILFIGHSLKDLKVAVKKFEKYVNEYLGLEIKPTAKLIDLSKDYIDILGRKISRRSLTLRASNFRKFRRVATKILKMVHAGKKIPVKTARAFSARYGSVKHTDSSRLQKKYHVKDVLHRCAEIIGEHDRRKYHEKNEIRFQTA